MLMKKDLLASNYTLQQCSFKFCFLIKVAEQFFHFRPFPSCTFFAWSSMYLLDANSRSQSLHFDFFFGLRPFFAAWIESQWFLNIFSELNSSLQSLHCHWLSDFWEPFLVLWRATKCLLKLSLAVYVFEHCLHW